MQTFNSETIEFLRQLSLNNNKVWFDSNREQYEVNLLAPMKDLAKIMEPAVKKIDPLLETSPAVGKAVSRIYRDIRFSYDKTPYRTDAWVSFKRPKRLSLTAPEFFIYFTAEEYQIGMGYYAPIPSDMARFRENILLDPERFGEFIDRFAKKADVKLYGENYKKWISNDLSEKFQDWFQKKNFYISRTKPIDDEFFSENLYQIMAEIFDFTSEAYAFLMDRD
jgi:uncharacterized protein (TIGR02453 family)